MKAQIEQIQQMATEGRLTSAQAAALIAELAGRAAPEPARPTPPRPAPPKRGLWGQLVHTTSHTEGVYASDLKDNDLSMSSIDITRGEGQIFRGNRLSMSSMSRVAMVRSEMSGNTISKSSLEDVVLEDARLTGSEILTSSVEALALRGGTIEDLACSASSLAQVSLGSESSLARLRLTSSQVHGLRLDEGARWEASEITGAHVQDLTLRAAVLEAADLQAVHLQDLALTRTRVGGAILRSVRLKKVQLVDCALTDLLLSGGEHWKRSGYEDVTFEGCKLHRAIFSECRFTRVTLRNVDASEIKAHRVTLSDRVIDGTEAFLAAIAGGREG